MKLRIRSWDNLIFQILVNVFLASILVAIAVPIWRVFMMSLTPLGLADNQTFGLWIPPAKWSIEAYKQLFNHPAFARATYNSVMITLGGTAISLALTTPLAYVLSNPRLPGRKFLLGFILVPFLFQAGLIPTYLVASNKQAALTDALAKFEAVEKGAPLGTHLFRRFPPQEVELFNPFRRDIVKKTHRCALLKGVGRSHADAAGQSRRGMGYPGA